MKQNKLFYTLFLWLFFVSSVSAQEEFFDDVPDTPIDDHLSILFVFALLLGFFFVRKQLKVRK